MADIINAASGYQTGSIDTATTLVNNVSPTDAKHINYPAGAIIQIETILGSGTTLKGSVADLATRLAVGVDSAGLLKLSTDASVTGPLSVAKGGTGGTVAGTVGLVPPGVIVPYSVRVAPTGYLLCDGSQVSRATYAALFAVLHQSTTITVTIATPGVVSWTAHGLENGDPVVFTTTGALPTGLTASTTYYVVSKATDTFQIAATIGGSAINTTGSQSGVHTGIHAPYGRGDASTTFHLPDLRGRVLIALDNLGGSAASRITSSSTNGINSTSLAGTGGAQTHTLTEAELATHDHEGVGQLKSSNAGGIGTAPGIVNDATTSGGDTVFAAYIDTTDAGSGSAHNNTQPWIAVSYIIKT